MNPALLQRPEYWELYGVVQRLALVSHAPIQGYDFAPNEVGCGERWRARDSKPPIPHLGAHSSRAGDSSIPRGNVDYQGDRTPEYRQKSAEYFSRRAARLGNVRQLVSLLKEAQDALEAWQKTPRSDGSEQTPERGSFFWKCDIADSDEHMDRIKDKYLVSQATVYRYRLKYRGLRSRPSAA